MPSQRLEAMVWPKLFACPSAILREPAHGEAFGMTDPMQPVGGRGRGLSRRADIRDKAWQALRKPNLDRELASASRPRT